MEHMRFAMSMWTSETSIPRHTFQTFTNGHLLQRMQLFSTLAMSSLTSWNLRSLETSMEKGLQDNSFGLELEISLHISASKKDLNTFNPLEKMQLQTIITASCSKLQKGWVKSGKHSRSQPMKDALGISVMFLFHQTISTCAWTLRTKWWQKWIVIQSSLHSMEKLPAGFQLNYSTNFQITSLLLQNFFNTLQKLKKSRKNDKNHLCISWRTFYMIFSVFSIAPSPI